MRHEASLHATCGCCDGACSCTASADDTHDLELQKALRMSEETAAAEKAAHQAHIPNAPNMDDILEIPEEYLTKEDELHTMMAKEHQRMAIYRSKIVDYHTQLAKYHMYCATGRPELVLFGEVSRCHDYICQLQEKIAKCGKTLQLLEEIKQLQKP